MAPNVGFPLQQSIIACIYKNAASRPPLEIDYDAIQISPWNCAEYEAGLAKGSAAIAKILKTERYGKINSTQFLAISASIARSNPTIHKRFKFISNSIDISPDAKRPSPGYLLLCAVGRGDVHFDDDLVSIAGWTRRYISGLRYTSAKRRTASMVEFFKSPSKKYKTAPASSLLFSKTRSRNRAGTRREESQVDPSACPDVLKIRIPRPTGALDAVPYVPDLTSDLNVCEGCKAHQGKCVVPSSCLPYRPTTYNKKRKFMIARYQDTSNLNNELSYVTLHSAWTSSRSAILPEKAEI
ncbi:hypothetical protein F5876DRAFT_66578 [Lentinula aff. lateritia]|uniref:Uncharacterized protein n=1 Tax=Lentinula aff. lateritia TaxID=2804960 RepID=A0ACC1TXJ6_9AGAR|nr:hypothetical protein F5876DRAFT_66578 [Lentinula aff. lateritia]